MSKSALGAAEAAARPWTAKRSPWHGRAPHAPRSFRAAAKPTLREGETASVPLKALWGVADAVGQAATAVRGEAPASAHAAGVRTPTTSAAAGARLPEEEALRLIKEDYDARYFISGRGDMAAYDPQCVFSDDFGEDQHRPPPPPLSPATKAIAASPHPPTDGAPPSRLLTTTPPASFAGTERFRGNVASLGALCEDEWTTLTTSEPQAVPDRPGCFVVEWRFASRLVSLPWRPTLAARGTTTHVLDATSGLVVGHEERWLSEPGAVVAALLRPTLDAAHPFPTNRWETSMLALSKGEWGEVFTEGVAPSAPAPALVVAGIVALARAADPAGYGSSGAAGLGEGALFALAAASLLAQATRFLGIRV